MTLTHVSVVIIISHLAFLVFQVEKKCIPISNCGSCSNIKMNSRLANTKKVAIFSSKNGKYIMVEVMVSKFVAPMRNKTMSTTLQGLENNSKRLSNK